MSKNNELIRKSLKKIEGLEVNAAHKTNQKESRSHKRGVPVNNGDGDDSHSTDHEGSNR
jgi:hypothetical protein